MFLSILIVTVTVGIVYDNLITLVALLVADRILLIFQYRMEDLDLYYSFEWHPSFIKLIGMGFLKWSALSKFIYIGFFMLSVIFPPASWFPTVLVLTSKVKVPSPVGFILVLVYESQCEVGAHKRNAPPPKSTHFEKMFSLLLFFKLWAEVFRNSNFYTAIIYHPPNYPVQKTPEMSVPESYKNLWKS